MEGEGDLTAVRDGTAEDHDPAARDARTALMLGEDDHPAVGGPRVDLAHVVDAR